METSPHIDSAPQSSSHGTLQQSDAWAGNDIEKRNPYLHPVQNAKAFISQFPTPKQFLANEWKDLVSMALVVAIVNGAMPRVIGKRLFPVPFTPEGVPDVNAVLSNAYPYKAQIIPVWLSAFLALVPPFVVITLFQITLKSYADFHAATYTLLTTLVHGTVFQSALKTCIGGLRPYFYDACRPKADLVPGSGRGWGGVMFGREVCTGETHAVEKALTGWPSGHSNAAMGGGLVLALYFNAHLKVFADARARYWKLFMVLCVDPLSTTFRQ
jgi:diacylglycerol diphosphate phosphatase/phosphatidate phosphatase